MLPFPRDSLHFPDSPSISPILICTFSRFSLHLTGIGKCKGRWSITNGHNFPDSPSIGPMLPLVYDKRASFHFPDSPSGLLPTGIGICKGGVAQMQGRQMQGGFIIILIQIRTQVDLRDFCILCRTLITQVAVRAIKAQQGAKASKCS